MLAVSIMAKVMKAMTTMHAMKAVAALECKQTKKAMKAVKAVKRDQSQATPKLYIQLRIANFESCWGRGDSQKNRRHGYIVYTTLFWF